MNIQSYLNQPFPKQEKIWRLIILISLFVSFFLIIFQPFGLNMVSGSGKIFMLSAYGLVTFIVLAFDLILIENLFPRFFDERNWKIWKEGLWLLWVIFSIGLGNAFYTIIIIDVFTFSIDYILRFQFFTLVIGVIPISILIITKQKYLLKKHIDSSRELNKTIDSLQKENKESTLIKIVADNDKDFIELNAEDLLFIESAGNYVEIYLKDGERIIRKTLRSTLKRALNYFKQLPYIIQCHRAFIVNLNKILSSKGNSQGLRLSLKDGETEVPVSRGFVNAVKERLS